MTARAMMGLVKPQGGQILFDNAWGRIRASVLGPGGQLFVTTSNGSNDKVVRIRPAAPVVARIAGANRYATAADFARDLERCLMGEKVSAKGPTP